MKRIMIAMSERLMNAPRPRRVLPIIFTRESEVRGYSFSMVHWSGCSLARANSMTWATLVSAIS